MNKIKLFFANLGSGIFAEYGESKIEEGLQELHDSNKAEYLATIHAVNLAVKKLTPIVQKSPTKIDDAFLKAFGEAVIDSAAANGIELA